MEKFMCSECKIEVEDDYFPEGWNNLEIVDTCSCCGNQEEYNYDFCCAEHRNKFILSAWSEYKEEMF
jgi:hypothetical protein